MIRWAAAVAWAVLLASAVSLAQEPADRPLGASRISGRVVTSDTGAPLASVRVTLEAFRLPGLPTTSLSRTATTDANGAFDFSGLPAGDYRLRTTKAGYLTKTGIGLLSSPTATVGERQSLPITMTMIRGGAISGRVFDAFGEPLAQVQVQVLRYRYESDGRRVPSPDGVSDVTDDLGQFRVYGLTAGDFIVQARGGAAPNGLGALHPATLAANNEISPTYFPGTINQADAQAVSLGPGQETSVQFSLVPARLRRISGTVIAAAGLPVEGLRVSLRSNTGDSIYVRGAGTVAVDGTFQITNVPPGNYSVDISQPLARDLVPAGGAASVSVDQDDVDGVSVVITKGATLQGDVVFEGARPRGLFQLQAKPAGTVGGPGSGLTGFAEVRADGRFEAAGLFDRVILDAVNDGWIVKSVVLDGVDVTDDPLDVAGRDIMAGLRVTVTDQQTSVAGDVKNDRGQTLKDHLVILLRTDRASSRPALAVRAVRTDAEGRFQTRGVRPGTYVVGVVEDLEAGYQFSPEFQERLRVTGRRVSLGDGEEIVLSLMPTSGLLF
jgi:protocatechuate 3,4-dioxygenase beta subunit